MITIIKKDQLHHAHEVSWLTSRFHFSFASYYNPHNMNFGALRVINDDEISPLSGFDTHPHNNMEIITYVIDGELTHKDSMGNESTLTRGQVQYMSAGTGVTHSEYNNHDSKLLTLLQIWIMPNKRDVEPNYGEVLYEYSQRENKWLHIASENDENSSFNIHQDVNMYAIEISNDEVHKFDVGSDRQVYLVNIEGESIINNHILQERDALTSIGESLTITTNTSAHILVIEMNK